MKKIVNILLLILIFTSLVSAIGISPSRTIINFEPNKEETITYTIYNQGDREVNTRIYVRGDLNESIVIPKENILVPAGGTKDFSVRIRLPSSLPIPGTHDNRIGVVESAILQSGATMVGAITGVETQLFINVPYPGKYLSADLTVGDVIIGEPLKLIVSLNSLGDQDISYARGKIEIFDPSNKQVATIYTESVTIKTKESKELVTYWNPKDIESGIYKAILTVDYDGSTANDEETFKLGDLRIDITRVNTVYINENNLVKFDIELESFWNEIINNVYADIKILDSSGEIDKIKTESIDMPPWAKRSISQYWPAKGEGKYKADVTLNYGNKTAKSSVDFEVKKSVKIDTMSILIILGIAIVILLIVIAILILRKKHETT